MRLNGATTEKSFTVHRITLRDVWALAGQITASWFPREANPVNITGWRIDAAF